MTKWRERLCRSEGMNEMTNEWESKRAQIPPPFGWLKPMQYPCAFTRTYVYEEIYTLSHTHTCAHTYTQPKTNGIIQKQKQKHRRRLASGGLFRRIYDQSNHCAPTHKSACFVQWPGPVALRDISGNVCPSKNQFVGIFPEHKILFPFRSDWLFLIIFTKKLGSKIDKHNINNGII